MSEPTFFGKIMDLIDREATDARPRPAPDVVRDLVGALAKLIEAAPAEQKRAWRGFPSLAELAICLRLPIFCRSCGPLRKGSLGDDGRVINP